MSALWSDCACVPLPTSSFQLQALLEAPPEFLGNFPAALWAWLSPFAMCVDSAWGGRDSPHLLRLVSSQGAAGGLVLCPGTYHRSVPPHFGQGWGYSRTSSVHLFQDLTPGSVEEAEEAEPDEEFKDAIEV